MDRQERSINQIWNKFIDIVSKTSLSDLTPSQRLVAMPFWYDAEVNNGGHSAFLDYWPDISAQDLIYALNTIGAARFSDIFQKALVSGQDDDYVAADRCFGECAPSLSEILQKYIFENYEKLDLWIG